MGVAMPLSLLAWMLEGSVFAILLRGVTTEVAAVMGLPSMGLATLATLVPAAPGFFGTFHAAAMQPLLWVGLDSSIAAAFSVLAHLVVWGPITVIGSTVGAFALSSGALNRHWRGASG